MSEKVQGFCPMGCGSTLFLASGNYITCSLDKCPDPCAANDILAENEPHHIVKFGEATFDVIHPLRERLGDDLFNCRLHSLIKAMWGPPVAPGRYRAISKDGISYAWQKLDD